MLLKGCHDGISQIRTMAEQLFCFGLITQHIPHISIGWSWLAKSNNSCQRHSLSTKVLGWKRNVNAEHKTKMETEFCTTTDGNSKSCRTKGSYLRINGWEFKIYCLHDCGCGKVELESSGVALWLYTKHHGCPSLSVCMQLLAYIPTICFPLPARVGRREGIPSANDAFRPCHSERSHPSISKRVWWRTTPSCLIRNPVFTSTTIFNRWFGSWP